MRSYKSVDQNFEKIRIFARFRHVALPALMAKMWPCKSLGRQGCMAKARENSVFFKILVHTFVRPHCFPFDVTLVYGCPLVEIYGLLVSNLNLFHPCEL